jgi:tetratricopeptide (TPR) repeat protein
MEKAVELEPKNARFIAELNELYINAAVPPKERLEFLEKNKNIITKRDDLKLDHVTAQNLCKNYEHAVELMNTYTFHPWECKEGLTGDQYVIANTALGVSALTQENYDKAITFFQKAMQFPDNFGEDKLCSATDNDLKYFAGLACERKGNTQKALQYYRDALTCDMQIYPAISLVAVSKPDYIFYRALALKKLGDNNAANQCFNQLIEYGIENFDKDVRFEYLEIGTVTTVIFDEDLEKRNKAYCAYLQALGELGLGQKQKAQKHLQTVLTLNPNHSRAKLLKELLKAKPSVF